MKKMFRDFRDFITRGNVVDLAIGIIIGSAFSSVVNSVVNNLMMPPFGLIIGNADFQDLFLILKQGEEPISPQATLQMAQEAGAVTFNYGQFFTDLISFLILGLGVFLIVKAIQKLENKVAVIVKKDDETDEELPSEKDCPYCLMTIASKASRCPYCTSQLEIEQEVADA